MQAKEDAVKQANNALAGSLAAQAESIKNDNHALALLLGAEAYSRYPGSLITRTTLFDLLQFTAYKKVDDFNGTLNSAAVSPDGARIAIASHNKDNPDLGEIRLFNETMDKDKAVILPEEYGNIYSLAFYQYSDKLILAAGGCDPKGCAQPQGQITLWEINNTGTSLLAQVSAHTSLVKTIAFSPDGKFLASGSYDTTIWLWDLSDLKKPSIVDQPLKHLSFVNDISFSPDGKYLVSAGDDRAIYVWDISQQNNIPQPVIYNKVYTAPVTSVAFRPDGKTLASAGNDNLVRLWDWNDGSLSPQPKYTLTGHTGYVKIGRAHV